MSDKRQDEAPEDARERKLAELEERIKKAEQRLYRIERLVERFEAAR